MVDVTDQQQRLAKFSVANLYAPGKAGLLVGDVALDLLRDEKFFVCKIRPPNPRIFAKRMMFGENHDHPFAPKRTHPAVPSRCLAGHDRDIDGVTCEGAKQPIMAPIDRAYIDIRKAPMVFDQRRVHVPCRRGGMNADRQQAKFATAPAPEPLEFRIHVIKYPLGARDELHVDFR